MENPVSNSAHIPAVINNPATSSDATIQSEKANPNAPASSDAKAKQFADMLDDQQQVTELGIKYETEVFDPAQEVKLNTPYVDPAETKKL